MKLTRLRLGKLPGIDAPFELGSSELAHTLHVVFGPNGSGKSSLVRALRAVLWPVTMPGEGIEVEASFENGSTKWFVRREGSRVTWQRDGAPSDPPALPPAELASSFLVTIEEVTKLDAKDFEGRIRSALAGGVDFAKLAEQWKWNDQRAKEASKRLREARRALEEREERLSALDQELQESASIVERLTELRKLHGDGETVARLIELDDAEGALEALAAQSKAFPPGMDSLSGKEADRERELRSATREAEDRLRAANEAVDRLEADAKRQVLAEPLSELELSTLEELVKAWDGLEDDLRAARAELVKAQESERAAVRRCPADSKPERLLDSVSFPAARLDRLVRDGARIEAARAAARSELERLPAGEEGPALERITSAAFALRGWLREPEPRTDSTALAPWLVVAAGCIGFVFMGSLVHPLYFAGAAVVIVLGLVAARGRRPAASARPAFERQYEAQSMGAVAWRREAVERRSNELEDLAAAARERAWVDARRREHEQVLAELDEQWSELESTRAEVQSLLGVDALAADFELNGFIEAVHALRTARDAVGAVQAASKQLESERELAAAAARSALARHDAREVHSVQAARGLLTDLRTRSRELREVLGDLVRAGASVTSAQGARDSAHAAKQSFWTGLGLEADAVSDLRARLARLPEWKRLKAEEQHRQAAITSLRRKLGERVHELEQGRAELERRLRDAREASARISELDQQVGGLQVRVGDARSRFDREAAASLVAQHRLELEQQLRAAWASSLGGLLSNEVKEEYERRSQPEVLGHAAANLEHFTHGRYGVRGERDGSVRVLDHASGRGLALDELSTGTRAQLFLALRHAFAAEAAHGERVPFVLDDALATSDPDRIRAVGDALRAITSEDGWQVLYLTTDAADVGMLVGGAREDVDVVDLAKLRKLQRGTLERDRLIEPAASSAPEPGDMTPEAYGELIGVPAIDPFAPVEALHPFHVMRDDLASLRRVLDARIVSLGVLERVCGSPSTLLEDDARARTQEWITFVRSALAAWRVGRGALVDRDALAHPDSGVSEHFLDALSDLAREVRGDAREFLRRLDDKHPKAKGFGPTKTEKLRVSLEERGHFDPQLPLDRESAWERSISQWPAGGRLEPTALRARFDWLWSAFERAERERRA